MDIIPLFPNALGKISNFISEDERLVIMKSIMNVKHKPYVTISGDAVSSYNLKYSYDFIEKNILNRLENKINEYARVYGISDTLKLDNIWSNIQNSGSVLEEHSHPNSYISGSLYINVNDSCSLTFHNPNPYLYFTNFIERTAFSFEWYKYPVKNCDLLLFPSWLRHGHHKHINQMNNRIIVSFNFGLG